ncbi:MAG: gamma-glutamyl-gamma-aminobutyrate hydrolase family protein [Deltaproteobacteria bacterium]|nr:gamma-glutamyl-gamma-aminobutyrate hydrolase family protein [Deltaproteobacteria bacterium]
MAKKILVFQHVAYEILGTLDPLLRQAGFRIKYVNFSRDPQQSVNLSGYDGLVILGGPMNVDQTLEFPHIKTELNAIEQALKKKLPMLGICLGSQLIAKALGARVSKNPQKEIGWYSIQKTEDGVNNPVLKHINDGEQIFQWHGDTFEIPKSAKHLATSHTCPNQAYVYADNVYGFQFHLEVDQAMIERWLNIPSHIEEIKQTKGQIDPEQIKKATPQLIRQSIALSDKVFGAVIEQCFGTAKCNVSLPSR